MVGKKLNLFVLLCFCLVLFPVTISRLGIINYIILYGFASMYVFFNIKLVGKVFTKLNFNQFLVIIQFIGLLFLSIVVPMIYGTEDFSYINVVMSIARKTILILFLAVLVLKYHGENGTIKLFMKYYIIATCAYVLGSFIFIIFPSFREIWRNVLGTSQQLEAFYSTYGYKTRFGWSGFSGFRQTIDCTLAILFSILLYFEEDSNRYLTQSFFYVAVVLCFIGNMLYGRIGTIASVTVFLIAVFLYKKNSVKTIATSIFTGVLVYALIIFLKERIPILNEWYNWSIIPMINFVTTGSFESQSVNHLINDMIFMPEFDTLILGDGRYVEEGSGRYYMHTDSGFMRQILFWGMGGSALSYSLLLNSVLLIGKKYIKFILLLMISFAIFEYKGEVYYEIIPIFFILGIWEKYHKRINEQYLE